MVPPNLQETIQHRLSVFRVPTVWRKPFSRLVHKWVTCSGVEWTVERLKSLKVDLYRIRSNLKPLTPWLAKNQQGKVCGVIGSLFRWALRSPQNFQSVVDSLMVYSLFYHDKLSLRQKEKFVKAVTAQTDTLGLWFHEALQAHVESYCKGKKLNVGKPTSLLTYRGSPSKRAPILYRKSMSQDSAGIESARYFAENPANAALYRRYEPLYSCVLEGIDVMSNARRMGLLDSRPTTPKFRVPPRPGHPFFSVQGGEVHFLQEAGLKLRAIASPYLVHQEALKPLGTALYSFMRTLPWDCTHDHTKPLSHVQRHLSNGGTVHSVDLSNATDFFPLECQLHVLRGLVGDHLSVNLFKEISRSYWKSSIGTIRWLQGQPLGLYPSFASFGISHGFLLNHLSRETYQHKFFVLGDDVIILDDLLYRRYMKTLRMMGCPHSPTKSLSSSSLCEFAGKVITSRTVYPSFKWREVSNDNFIDIVRNYGRPAVTLLSARQKKVVKAIQHCVEPLGLNWSFPGSNREIMEQLTRETFSSEKKVLQSLTRLFRVVAKNYYNSSNWTQSVVQTDVVASHLETFDEKVVATLQKFLSKEWVQKLADTYQLASVSGVPGALGNSDLPLEIVGPSRVTTLDRYRDILNR